MHACSCWYTVPTLQGSSKQTVMGIIEKHRSAAPAKPKSDPAPSDSTASAETAKPAKTEKTTDKTPSEKTTEKTGKKAGTGKATGKAGSKSAGQKGASSKKGAAEVSSGPSLVVVPNGKESRQKDEEKLKTLKWNFQSPRSEHIEQLKEQMVPCVSADLHAGLFHDDFKKHIAALATLTKVP